MIRIMLKSGIFIGECRNSFVKGNTMLTLVVPFFTIIPRKLYFIHIANILLR